MPKPGDPGDATQPLSESQVVAVTPTPPAIATNDQSVAWKGTVVSADEFAPAKPRPSRAKWVVVGALGIGALGAGAYELVPRNSDEPAKIVTPPVGSAMTAVPPPVDAAQPPVDAALPVDAAELPADAAVPASTPAKTTKKKKPRHR